MSRNILTAGILALAGCAASGPVETNPNDEAKLATELEGYRQSGPAVACVNSRNLGGNRSVGEGVIIFGAPGSDLYVNRPAAGCPELRSTRALRVSTTGSQLCRGDIVSVIDTVSGMDYGACSLGDFTPYERNPG